MFISCALLCVVIASWKVLYKNTPTIVNLGGARATAGVGGGAENNAAKSAGVASGSGDSGGAVGRLCGPHRTVRPRL